MSAQRGEDIDPKDISIELSQSQTHVAKEDFNYGFLWHRLFMVCHLAKQSGKSNILKIFFTGKNTEYIF